MLSQVRAFSGEEADGPALCALERGSQAAYVSTLSVFLRFLHCVSEATMLTQLAMSTPAPVDRQPTPDETAAAFGGPARRPAIDVPDLVRDAVGRLFQGGLPVEAVGAAVFFSSLGMQTCAVSCRCARSHCMAILGHFAYPAETRPVHTVFNALSSGASLAANKIGIGDFYRELLRRSLTILGGVCVNGLCPLAVVSRP
jgi:hypothetical protein